MNGKKIAVPYYGRLYRSKSGCERIYFIVEPTGGEGATPDVKLHVWDDRREMSLPEWFRNIGVESLVCRDAMETGLEKKLWSAGIEILNGNDAHAGRLLKSLMI